jgi:hypothetical protein
MVLSLAVLSTGLGEASAAADDTFADCDSAANYGWSTAWQFGSGSLNRVSCDQAAIERAEAALARSLKKLAIPARNPESTKVCFYEGVYHGYIDALASKYASCDRAVGLLPSVARAAVSVFAAMQSSLQQVDGDEVDHVFEGAFVAPEGQGAECEAYVLGSEAAGHDDGLTELVESVCWNE